MSIAHPSPVSKVNNNGYQVSISYLLSDSEWDTFVAHVPGGHLTQTSLWGQVKSTVNWSLARVSIKMDGQILGGAQLLFRSFLPFGKVGYVTKGPLCRTVDPGILKLIVEGLFSISKKERIKYLVVQPPSNGEGIASFLLSYGLCPGLFRVAPTATVSIDLSPEYETLFSQVSKSTRRSIRSAEKRGISVREGTIEDVGTFYNFYLNTSSRQKFVPYPKEYMTALYNKLGSLGYIRLFLAECDGGAVSSLLVSTFNGTVEGKFLGWSGCSSCSNKSCHPNEVLFWECVRWAKSQGYRYFDFGGIDPAHAKLIEQEGELPKSLSQTTTRFKMGFGGQIVFYPGPCDFVFNPFLRSLLRLFSRLCRNYSLIYEILDRLHI